MIRKEKGNRPHIDIELTEGEYLAVREYADAVGLSLRSFGRIAIQEKLLLEGRYYIKLQDGTMQQVRGIM